MDSKTIRDNFVVDSTSISVQAEKPFSGPGLVRLMVPADNMRGFHGRGMTVDSTLALIDRLKHAVDWLQGGGDVKQF